MIFRTFLFTILLLFTFSHAIAQEQISLNGDWKFALAKTDNEAFQLKDFYIPDYNITEFSTISVPSNWAVLGFEEPVYRGFDNDKASEGFYIHDFIIPKAWESKRILLHFGGVWSFAEVWINGTYLGGHKSGYTSFTFDITGKLKSEISNKLAVRVRQVSNEYKFDVYDDWTLGGIFRDVTLEAMPKNRYIDYITTKTTFDQTFNDAELEIKCMIDDRIKGELPGNYPSPGNSYQLRFTLSTLNGKKITSKQITIPAHTSTSREVKMVLQIESPLHWTAETPNLYTLNTELIENGNVSHTKTERIGFRQISVDGGVFRINGQAVKLRGVNRHDEHPDVGRATRREHWLQDIKLMKAANINYIRLAHYPHAKGFIELCDSLGMYLGEEVSIGGGSSHFYDPSQSGAALVRSYETVFRDINNPSIVYWSVGNEDPLTSMHMISVKLVKALDPTRPVLLPWRPENWLPEEVDMMSIHYWHPHEYDEYAGQSTRPIITTEYTHAFGVDGLGGLEDRWKALTKHPQGAGGAVWMWADQGIKTPVKRPSERYDKIEKDDEYLRIDDSGWDGIVDSYRNPTRDYWEVKAVYAPVYPTCEKVSFFPGQKTINIPIQNDFDFTDLNSLKIKWTIKEDNSELASGTSHISGMPHTVSNIELPIESLKTIQNDKTYYVWLDFMYENDQKTVRNAVELSPFLKPESEIHSASKITVIKGDTLAIVVDKIQYNFNPSTGHLVSASFTGKNLITNLLPTIWDKPDRGASMVIGSKLAGKLPDLNHYSAHVKEWNVCNNLSNIVIEANVEYRINEKNYFITQYQYQIDGNGELTVHYEISPFVETPNLPIVGMSLQSSSELDKLNWLGLGPYDAYPNKQSAPYLGFWGGAISSGETDGNKATRRIEISGKNAKVNIFNIGYLKHDVSNPYKIQILSTVLGKPEKGRKPYEKELLLQPDKGKHFIGEFRIELEAVN